MNDPRETVVSLDATRLGIESVVLVALPGELFPDRPWPRPHRRIFDRDFIFERAWPSVGPTLNDVQVLTMSATGGTYTLSLLLPNSITMTWKRRASKQ